MHCIVCESETKKYKCPKCFEYYCSVDCFKTHKDLNCSEKPKEVQEQEQVNEPVVHLPFKTEDTVDITVLNKLANSNNLKKLLQNPHLRNYLLEIDNAPSAWKAMKIAMYEPLFIEFADECLHIVEPDQYILNQNL